MPVASSPFASWGRRAGGWVIDLVLIWVVVGIPMFFALGIPHAIAQLHNTPGHPAWLTHRLDERVSRLTLIAAGATFLYSVAFLASSWRATVGMRMVSVRLIVADTGSEEVELWRVLARGGFVLLLTVLSALVQYLGLLGLVDYLWPLWDARRQTLHDKVAGTAVVHVIRGD